MVRRSVFNASIRFVVQAHESAFCAAFRSHSPLKQILRRRLPLVRPGTPRLDQDSRLRQVHTAYPRLGSDIPPPARTMSISRLRGARMAVSKKMSFEEAQKSRRILRLWTSTKGRRDTRLPCVVCYPHLALPPSARLVYNSSDSSMLASPFRNVARTSRVRSSNAAATGTGRRADWRVRAGASVVGAGAVGVFAADRAVHLDAAEAGTSVYVARFYPSSLLLASDRGPCSVQAGGARGASGEEPARAPCSPGASVFVLGPGLELMQPRGKGGSGKDDVGGSIGPGDGGAGDGRREGRGGMLPGVDGVGS
ncbi:hypothetical protein OF83DRAFT_884024 [Amylostereum chailletii]|nr:hypothetical protein OF83DRAFT_884024 [Amylostereum chailletii]